MRRRFLLSMLASDLGALFLGLVVASLLVFETPNPWAADLGTVGASLWPLVILLVGGVLLGSYASLRMWARGAPRPSYGRAFSIVLLAGGFTSVGILVSRTYFSRPFLAATLGVTTLLALLHRAYHRRRPWMEQMVLVTGEKGLVDDMRDADHADVLSVYDPAGDPPSDPKDTTATLVVDLRPVMADRMAQFVSSWNLAGYRVRPLASVYEEHTGRLPIVHLAEGWELTDPVARNEYAAFKRGVDIVLTLAFAPIWIPLGAIIWLAVKFDSRGPAIYKQERVGRLGEPFTLLKFRTMVLDAESEGPRFAAGQGVLVREIKREGHTHLPLYLRGKTGEVESDRGLFLFPQAVGHAHEHGDNETVQHVYCVRFAASEIWAEGAGEHSLNFNLWDYQLEPA